MVDKKGYILIILMVVVFLMGIALMVATPIWHTQIQREKEEELIFRGKQYVEAVRLFQLKFPGNFPETLEELVEEKCLRKLYKDPMTEHGQWNLILHQEGAARSQTGSPQKVLVAPQSVLLSISNPQILGVVSTSTKKSFKLYYSQDAYDKWLFYYGQDPSRMPEIIYYGQAEKSP